MTSTAADGSGAERANEGLTGGGAAGQGRAWAVAVRMRTGRLTFAGRLGSAHVHAHAAVQLLLVTCGQALLTDADGRTLPVSAAVIPAGAAHALDAEHAHGVMVYLDPSDRQARALTARLNQPAQRTPDRSAQHVAAWQAAALPAQAVLAGASRTSDDGTAGPMVAGTAGIEAGDRAVAVLAGQPDPASPPPGSALHHAMEVVHRLAATGEPIRLQTVAAQVGLSASRLRHLFTEQVGLPFTACVRWARLQTAMHTVRDGGTLTAAAHTAGFTDSAHLTRVFRAMFGLTPSAAARHLHWC